MKSVRGVLGVCLGLFVILVTCCAHAVPVHTNPLNNDPLVREAFEHFYNLDYPGSVSRFERFHAMHPGDPQATVLLLDAVLFQELYRLDLLDTTFYANDGFLTGRHATGEDPRAKVRIFALADESIQEADWRISHNPNDVDAYYARGWAKSLKSAYMAMVERSFGAAFRLAIAAKNDHQKVLQIDPAYQDAKLVVGVYEYVVGALPLPFKILIGFAGMSGSKSKGMAMLHEGAEQGVITSVECKTVIALFLRREARYKEAIEVVRALKARYPHDFLFGLEEANLRKDDGQGMVAVHSYEELLSNAARPGFYTDVRLDLAYFGLGDALRGQRHVAEAAEAYEKAAFTRNAGAELKVRSLLAAGECRDLTGDRQKALQDYHMAIDAAPNTSRADTARKRLHSPYRGV